MQLHVRPVLMLDEFVTVLLLVGGLHAAWGAAFHPIDGSVTVGCVLVGDCLVKMDVAGIQLRCIPRLTHQPWAHACYMLGSLAALAHCTPTAGGPSSSTDTLGGPSCIVISESLLRCVQEAISAGTPCWCLPPPSSGWTLALPPAVQLPAGCTPSAPCTPSLLAGAAASSPLWLLVRGVHSSNGASLWVQPRAPTRLACMCVVKR
jgi:hypothetical protein